MTSLSAQSLLSPEEAKSIARRLSLNLTGAAVLFIGLGLSYSRPDQILVADLIQFVAATIVGIAVVFRGLRGFLQPSSSAYSDQLVAIAVIAAAVSGDFVTATIVPLVLDVGRIFEERSTLGSQAAIEHILSLQAQTAIRLKDGNEEECAVGVLEINDIILLRPGESIPADGLVVSGRSMVDSSSITGESQPQAVNVGDSVYGGTINLRGVLKVQIQQLGEETELGKVISLLQEAEKTKIPLVKQVERLLAYYLPISLCLAGTVLFFTEDLSRAIAILVVSCPTALALAGPSVMISALSAAAQLGCIIKSGNTFEKLSKIDTLALDKTGTLTQGTPKVSSVVPVADVAMAEVLQWGAALAKDSLHPISQAIHAAHPNSNWVLENWSEYSGQGVQAEWRGRVLRMGRLSWLASENVDVQSSVQMDNSGAWVSIDCQLLGFIQVEDKLLPQAKKFVETFRTQGVSRCIMLTGDESGEAGRIAEIIQFENIYSGLLPKEKLEQLNNEKNNQRRVLMVGDGINDALALQAADVGIAIGDHLSAAALGGADAALFSQELQCLPKIHRLSLQVERIIVQNVVLGITMGVILFCFAVMGYMSPILAAIFHSLGVLLVLISSSRIYSNTKD